MRPATTSLYALDIGSTPDRVWLQNPANAGTLVMPKPIGIDLGDGDPRPTGPEVLRSEP
jgi:hypothetical protein